MIVVTAPTGNISSQVLAQLVKSGEPVRVAARDPSRPPDVIRSAVEIVEGSHAHPNVVAEAFDGAEAVFWLTPSDPTADGPEAAYVDFVRPAAQVLERGTVQYVVAVSALGRGWPRDAGHVTATLAADDITAQSGVAFRALACSSLMENVLRQIESIRNEGVYRWPSPPDLALPHVATCDVADVAVRLLRNTSWTGVSEVPLTGPETLTFDEMAVSMGEVLGRSVRFEPIPMETMRDMMISFGGSPGMAQSMIEMVTAKNEGIDAIVPLSPPSDTPTTFRQWCQDVLRPAIEG